MKRLSALILALLLVPILSFAGQIQGTLQTPTGGTVNNGTLTFNLSQAALVPGSSSIVPSTVSCYTSNTGIIVGVPDALSLPVVSTNTASGTLASGTYYVKITYWNGTGESAASPEKVVVLSAQGTLIIQAPTVQPANATGYKVYISSASGTEKLQGTVTGWTNFSQSSSLVSVTSPSANNTSSCSLRFSDELIPTGTYYTVNLLNVNGSQFAGYPQTWCTYGGAGGVINVSNGAPTGNCGTNGVFYPTPIMANPASSPQSIQGDLNLSGVFSSQTVNGIRNAGLFASIQAAINDLGVTGGMVRIPVGTYSISTTLSVPSNTTIVCDDREKTILDFSTSINGMLLSSVSNVRIENCTLKSTAGISRMIDMTSAQGVYIVNNNITGATVYPASGPLCAVTVDVGSSDVWVKGNSFFGNGVSNAGVVSDFCTWSNGGLNTRIHFRDNKIFETLVKNPVSFYDASYSDATGNTIDQGNFEVAGNNNGYGILCYRNTNFPIGNIFSNNTIKNTAGSGIYGADCLNPTITDNQFFDVAKQQTPGSLPVGAIALGNAPGAVITGNVINTSTQHGIHAVTANNAVISNNTISTVAADGVNLGTSTNAAITGNTVIGAAAWGMEVDVASTGTSVGGNIVAGVTGAYNILDTTATFRVGGKLSAATIGLTLLTGNNPFSYTAGAAGRWDLGANSGGGTGDDSFAVFSATYGAGHASRPTFKILSTGAATFDSSLEIDGGQKIGSSGSVISDSRELVQSAHSCGTTTTCANTANGSNRMIFGTVALTSATPSTAVVSGISPLFTSTTSYVCVLTNMTTQANPLKVTNTSTSSFTITGPNTVTDTVAYMCVGN